MKSTIQLIEKFVKHYNEYNFEGKDLSIQDYNLNGTLLTIKYSYLKDDISELDIKYNTAHYNYELNINILDYLTFITQLKRN